MNKADIDKIINEKVSASGEGETEDSNNEMPHVVNDSDDEEETQITEVKGQLSPKNTNILAGFMCRFIKIAAKALLPMLIAKNAACKG